MWSTRILKRKSFSPMLQAQVDLPQNMKECDTAIPAGLSRAQVQASSNFIPFVEK
jgi:hypothetical protein